MKSVLLTGSSSLLGKALLETAPIDLRVVSTYNIYCPTPAFYMNILDPNWITTAFSIAKPDVVIHCAANGDVDYAENKPAQSSNVNVKGTMNVMDEAKKYNAKFVYMSTNAVFDGEMAPYSEMDERNPINQYGKIKVDAENKVVTMENWMIIRPIFLYGWHFINSRTNFVTRTLDLLHADKEVLAANDIITQPTYAKDCARTIWGILDLDITNQIIHIAPEKSCSLFEFAKKIAEVFDYKKSLVKGVPSSHFKTLAPRPLDTTYNVSKLNSMGFACIDYETGLNIMKEEE